MLPEPSPSQLNERRVKKKRGAGVGFLWLLTLLIALATGYALREFEIQNGDPAATAASLRANLSRLADHVSTRFLPRTPTVATPIAPNVAVPESPKIDPQAAARFTQLGDEAYARARQLLQKGTTTADRRRVTQELIEELQVALNHYETAQTHSADDAVLRDKIAVTRKAIADLTRNL